MSILMQLETATLVTRPDGTTKSYRVGLVHMEESDVPLYLNQQLEARSKKQQSPSSAQTLKTITSEPKAEKKEA
ncbi:hypothetical protein [Entomobacter blattae]|uniref:Uncharacterized protein n=1 Tax=Entomobacter blattae TaxID=2762277 RepID=A0A7H1NTZ7_9PROT|nr:hypothetical protein [Entomobacter blattae]QNT79257.1 hypothetical protein JGUZn3_20520 [Entomobacter blattae]